MKAPSVLALGAISVILFLSGCGTSEQPCGPDTCDTCCTDEGQCVLSVSVLACGANGGLCSTCAADQTCALGVCLGGGGGSPDGSGPDAGTGNACAGTLVQCGDACVDTKTSLAHCDRCNRSCGPGEVCGGGSGCAPLPKDCVNSGGCPTGFYCEPTVRSCMPGCLLDRDCPAGATCDVATHQCLCPGDQHACGQVCVSSLSTESCGTSCTPCPPPPANATSTCEDGECGFRCNVGFHACSGQCVPNDSPLTCGTACSPCPVPTNGKATCNGNSCGFTCNAPYVPWQGSCCRPRTQCNPGECGTVSDGCGGTLSCGGCSLGTCNSNRCDTELLPCTPGGSQCAPNTCIFDRVSKSYLCAATYPEARPRCSDDVSCLGSGRGLWDHQFHVCDAADVCARICLTSGDCPSGTTCHPWFDHTISPDKPGHCR